ncbi:hypothetical protein ACFL2Q_03035 [Thermodesulfobacteriota bacterium]
MTVTDWIVWYLLARETIFLYLCLFPGYLLVWLFALLFSRARIFKADHEFAEAYNGFNSWRLAFIVHVIALLCLGGLFFVPVYMSGFSQDWYLSFAYLLVILIDFIFIGVHSGYINEVAE